MKLPLWSFVCIAILATSSADDMCDPAMCHSLLSQSLDGCCNNLQNPNWGSAFTPYKRGLEGAEYEDGMKEKVKDRPNERDISNSISINDDPPVDDPIRHNQFAVFFGQFVNHDFDKNDEEHLFDFPPVFATDITITDPSDDFCFFAPDFVTPNGLCEGPQPPFIPYRPSNGTIIDGQFEVTNRGTSYLDLGTVYGNDVATGAALRTNVGGHLKTSDYLEGILTNLPPSSASTPGVEIDTGNSDDLTAGDFRINQNIGLALMHTLFLREHNKLADEIAMKNPLWNEDDDDEKIFQAARRRNIAQYQKIVLYEYFPAEFGTPFAKRMGPYVQYNETEDPSTSAAFAAAAFRYAHSSLKNYPGLDECGGSTFMFGDIPNLGLTGGPLTVPVVLESVGGIEAVLRGLVATNTALLDVKYDDEIRNFPIPNLGGGIGIDLMALDLQRGRNNGIPNYERLREVYNENGGVYGTPGCPSAKKRLDHVDDPKPCFRQIITGSRGKGSADEEALVNKVRDLYGKVKRVDPMIGLLMEKKVPDTSFGETLGTIIMDQFRRARDGDRFWYENIATTKQEIKDINMKVLLERNFNFELENNLPDEVFLAHTFSC